MSERLSAVMDGHLVEIFVEKLTETLADTGFTETLKLTTPRVSQFQRDSDVIVVQTEHAPGHRKQKLTVESETLDVSLIVDSAAREVVEYILDQILSALQREDRLGKTPSDEKGTSLSDLEMAFGEWNRRTAT